ncbi:MAG: ATP synthase F1 subunit epsilon [Planctomycetales bacterium]|nr:ATP synthase F1 subunit epsilon [Planctomycetales bacterium]NIM09777.1 ATP synthase F1 subunit epsilon [Planctomycetales bacterium]NIN09246.1 ATP synthase F1 subunit epsilon [Planctomycetales bacterium]NIN78346.1 ATP synthase F1 subunit epsilon [Planctomycetales bacterium]NIO35525.1 ATP synthase F1 subunit epsilon [Planctomycetales bacterium]
MESPKYELAGQRILSVVVVTPETTALETPAQFVALPLYDGEIGIAPGRAPLIGRLGYGEMRIVEGNETRRYYVDGGFVEMSGNTLTVLTHRAVPADQLDAEAAQQQLDEALRRPANSQELLAVRDRLILQARAQIRTARRAG